LHLKKFSPSAVELINLQERDIGRPLEHITTNIRVETITEDIRKVIREGSIIVKEVQSANKFYQVTTTPYIRQKDNTIDGAIITFYEITELKRLQTELEGRNKSLVRINEDLDTFVYTVSHNLLSPIAHIQGLIELLQMSEKNISPEAAEYYRMIEEAIVKFREIIRELSEIGKVESEKLMEGEEVDLKEIVEDIKLSISSMIAVTHTQIDTAFEVSAIHFSKKNLRSILYNLISNAIKYRSAERPPQIMLRTKAMAGGVLLSVQDNGMGIEEEKINSIFTLYQRLSHQVEGQGIGLYLTKKIIHAAGGYIEVDSKVGEGTIFKLYFKL
jgi:two-component system CheB/CheR fusion protein